MVMYVFMQCVFGLKHLPLLLPIGCSIILEVGNAMENVGLALVVYQPPQTDQRSVLPPPAEQTVLLKFSYPFINWAQYCSGDGFEQEVGGGSCIPTAMSCVMEVGCSQIYTSRWMLRAQRAPCSACWCVGRCLRVSNGICFLDERGKNVCGNIPPSPPITSVCVNGGNWKNCLQM